MASCVTRSCAPAGATRARSSRAGWRSALRSPPAAERTIASAARPPRAALSAALIEPSGSAEARRLAPPPAPRPTTSPLRFTAKARVFVAPASIPTTYLLVMWATCCAYRTPSRQMQRAARDRACRAGRRGERVRESAQPIRAEDRKGEGLAERRRHAEGVGQLERDRRDGVREHPHERRVPRAAAGDEHARGRRGRLAAERLTDGPRGESGRRRERVVVVAALPRAEIVRPLREGRAEQLAAGALRRAPREVRLAQPLRERLPLHLSPRRPAPGDVLRGA